MTRPWALVWLLLAAALPCRVSGQDFGDARYVPRDLLDSFKEEGTAEGLLTILGSGAAAGAAAPGDVPVKNTLQSRRPLGKRAVDAGAFIGSGVLLVPLAGGAFIAGAAAHSGPLVESGLMGLEALAVSGVETEALKVAVGRRRPDRSDRYSFPSGHASASFAVATVAAWQYGWEAGVPAYLAAGYVGYTRMEGNKHWLSDVVFGAGLGVAAGRAVYKVHRRSRPERFAWAPYFFPGGGGIAVRF